MKKLLLSIIVLTAAIGTTHAQKDYCKDVKKYGSAYSTPLPTWKLSEPTIQIVFARNNNAFDIGLLINSYSASTSNTTASIEFEDGTKLEYSGLVAVPVPKGYGTYNFTIHASNGDMDKFRTTKIKALKMMGETAVMLNDDYKTKIMAFANCPFFASDPANTTTSSENKGNGESASGTANTIYTTKPIEAFWGIKFGSSPDEAKKLVISKGGKFEAPASKPDQLGFTGVVFTGRQTESLLLNFIDGKFYESSLKFPIADDAQVISLFNTIQKELDDVYGHSDINASYEYPYKEGDGETVQAIKFGHATIFAKWTSSNGNTIQLQINKDLSFNLFYTDATLKKATVIKKSSDY